MADEGRTRNDLAAALRRIAAALDGSAKAAPAPAPRAERPTDRVASETARRMLEAIDLRSQYFDGELFSDPAWSLMLDIYGQMSRGRRTSLAGAAGSARAPVNTAQRWINLLTERGFLVQKTEGRDPKRVYVELSPDLFDCMTAYLGQVASERAGDDLPRSTIFRGFQ